MQRITAEAALNHQWFYEVPLPKSKDFMPTFPAQHAQDRCPKLLNKQILGLPCIQSSVTHLDLCFI